MVYFNYNIVSRNSPNYNTKNILIGTYAMFNETNLGSINYNIAKANEILDDQKLKVLTIEFNPDKIRLNKVSKLIVKMERSKL